MADTENNKNSNSPALRFPGFTEPWKVKNLEQICSINPKSGKVPEQFVYIDLESIEKGILKKKSIICRDNAPSRAQRVVKHGDVLYQCVRPYQNNHFIFSTNDELEKYVASTGFAQLRNADNPYFLFYSIQTPRFTNDVLNRCTGSNYPAINSTDLSSIQIGVPTLREQEKISSMLCLLDERIETQRRLIDKLETLIKGIVVSHFNNCNTKETISIKDLGEAYSVGNLSKDDLSESGKPCIIYGELFTTYGCVAREIQSRTSKYNQATLSRAGDLLFPASTTVDAISLIAPTSLQADGVYVAGDMFGIHILPKFNSEYISYLLNYVYNRTLSKYAQGSTIIHLHYADIKNTTIQVPCLEEQNKCAELMEALQIKLDVAKQLIDCYQLQKSNLLQRMFI